VLERTKSYINSRKQPVKVLAFSVGAAIVSLGLVVSAWAASLELQDRAVLAGINYPSTPSWDVCTADYNNDGNEDFHASLHMKSAGALYTNMGDGGFSKVVTNIVSPRPTPGYGSKAFVDRHACAWADVDGNGLLDLYNSAGRWASNKYKDAGIDNELYLQTAPGVFTDVATEKGVGEPCTRGRFVVFADFNGDGKPELFLGAQKERADTTDVCNTLADSPYNEQSKVFVNLGNDENGTWLGFRTAPEYNVSLANTGNRFAVAWDENNDGKVDLLTQTFVTNRPLFYRNNGTSFTEISRAGTKKLPAMNGVKVGDINRDGINDLVFADNNGFAYLRGTATGITTVATRIGSNVASNADGWNVAIGDINGDGLLDVYGQTKAASGSVNPDDIVYVAQPDGSFVPYVAPSATGDANDVESVLVNGRAQFVVLNGGNDEKEAPGPIQLIYWVDQQSSSL